MKIHTSSEAKDNPRRLSVGDVLACHYKKLWLKWTVIEIVSDDGDIQIVFATSKGAGSARIEWSGESFARLGRWRDLTFFFQHHRAGERYAKYG